MVRSKKTVLQEQTLQDAAPVQEQTVTTESAQAAAEENQPEETAEPAEPAEPLHLVILAHPGTEDLVQRIWKKFYDLPFIVIATQEADSVPALLESLMANEAVDRIFVVVPANLVPCAPVRWSELQTPRADDQGHDRISFWGRVPVRFDKEFLADFLPLNDGLTDEAFVKSYVCNAARPELVSHSYGNFYTKVLRATPCESVVIEGLVRKRFIYASPAGWNAITDLLVKALL